MILRYIHTLWIYFWRTLFTLAGLALMLILIFIGVLQLPQSKEYLRAEIENSFNNQFEGNLQLERIDGFLPFTASLEGIQIYSPSDSLAPVLQMERAEASVSWWLLLQKNFVMSDLTIYSPVINVSRADHQSTGFARAFRARSHKASADTTGEAAKPNFIERINIFAPSISVEDGKIMTDASITPPDVLNLPESFSLENLNFMIFLDVNEDQIFFELPSFIARIPGTPYEYLELSGQFYNDGEFFELNRFRIGTELGYADFSFESYPVDIRKPGLTEQFKTAQYGFEITESSFDPSFIKQFFQGYPEFSDNLLLTLQSEGNAEEYFLDRLQATVGESSVLISGSVGNLLSSNMSFQTQLDNMVIHPNELNWISEHYFDSKYDLNRYQISTIMGELEGDSEYLNVDFNARTEAGAFHLDGNMSLIDIPTYNLNFEVDSLDITPFIGDSIRNSILQGSVELNGRGLGEQVSLTSRLDLSQSIVFGYSVNEFEALFNYENGELGFNIFGTESDLLVSANGSYANRDSRQSLTADGRVQNFDVKKFAQTFHADSTNFSSTFSTNIQWSSIDDMTGRVSFEMEESTINADTLRPHQFYADISDVESSRRLRFTSSFFDGEINGTLNTGLLKGFKNHWQDYFHERINTEFRFIADSLQTPRREDEIADGQSLNLSVEMAVKDLSLLRMYFPNLPELESNARFNTTVNATAERLLITGNLFDERVQFGGYSAENLNTEFTASLRNSVSLKESSTIDLQLHTGEATINGFDLKESRFELSMRDDSIYVNQFAERLQDDLVFNSGFHSLLRDDHIQFTLEKLVIGSSAYRWASEGTPVFTYNNQKKWIIDSFVMTSDNDYLRIQGTYSNDAEDVISYEVENFDLHRISDLINGRVNFSGIMNGDFQTRTLGQIPAFQGNFRVEEARIRERLIGDLSFNSVLNSGLNRFDTNLRIFTNPEKYSAYLQNNDDIGQDIELTGYFKIPDDSTDDDEDLFYFDADLREIDLWIVTVIVPNIITEMEGLATGRGTISGTLKDFDFDARFEVPEAYGTPAFTNVDYGLSGELTFNKSEGLIFHDIRLTDSAGGTGILSGTVDLDNFSPTTYIDLSLDLDDLHFLNNPFDPEIPFYGSVYGTGRATITGTNFSPVLRTVGALSVSSNSRISIPLEPQTEVEQEQRFIQFVNSFEQPFWGGQTAQNGSRNGNGGDTDLTFLERFTMDLQFQANNPITVRMIFDQVTSDILSANGTGQIRILLEDQDVSMFGRFNITSGEYQFVSGDIFTRRFTLQQGGTISWTGDLVDAALDVTAIYRARPNISTLLPSTGAGVDQSRRIPIELVLHIGGTILQVENEFFFRTPSGFEGVNDPTITAQINNLNQNEDEKLIQATSILISGNFLPSDTAQGLGITESFSGAAVVSPFVTSQIINPLLSNQINSLLRSDITFDIDFNLNAFNEVDLGVALRLFDDRIVLRREGQITGEQSDIGDLGATYRINRTFSVSAFHRQDPTFSYTSGIESRQSQEMNGIGIEAQMQFNSWKNFRAQVANAFRKLFGIKNEDNNQEEIAENNQNN